jgi:hypothetical protein
MSDEKTRAGANPAELSPPLPVAQSNNSPEDTEALLNSLIAECREYVRAVGEQFSLPETDPHTRWKFMEMIIELVKTGAFVGDAIAKLRGGASGELRQRIIVERIAALGGGGGRILENE